MAKRNLYRLLARLIPEGGSLLDLACGDGTFLREAVQAGAGRVVGVELAEEKVLRCVAAGLPVYQGDITEGLADYPDGVFDCVSLIRTVELLARPEPVLREMLRVGRTVLITFVNLGHWRNRLRFLFGGRVPGTIPDGLDGFPTGLSYSSFRRYCRKEGIAILRLIPFPPHPLAGILPGLFARELVVLLAKDGVPEREGKEVDGRVKRKGEPRPSPEEKRRF
ncbi:MAG: methyltransferase domain-containing protein [Firmicutes bacterium]|nr:methyltransferase domain-containing protein [Bacillota bacterium]